MAKDKNKKGDYVEIDVSPLLLDDEKDAVTGEVSPDEDPHLDEALIGGEAEAKALIRNVYNNLSCVVGEYYGSYSHPLFNIIAWLIPLTVLVGFYSYGIISAVRGEFTLFTAFIVIACTAVMGTIMYSLRKDKITVWWWKEKNRTVSVYKMEKGKYKGDVIVYVNRKYMWRYVKKLDKWEINGLDLMGSRLFFSKLNGELRSKKLKNGKVRIGAYKREDRLLDLRGKKHETASIVLKDGVPLYIENVERSTVPNRAARYERFYFKEINSDVSVSLPKSFRDFCEENVIEPLEENERLYYV